MTRHANALWLVAFVVFAYRDLYPLAAFHLTPMDIAEGLVLWIKIAFLAFLAMIIPLGIPRVYVPLNPKSTCSYSTSTANTEPGQGTRKNGASFDSAHEVGTKGPMFSRAPSAQASEIR
ncbi:hypothetical protein D9757_014636 [Collybiopsis confluens]|uniref:Uncharacterized protein n=1 Tax=Collybiopsis confluens TaxID=2823264 RepID=A0A8H5FNA1_9AGAR|nr:hypothetical protein D9757_014636 [Collybiopsis confluens]